MKLYNLAVEDFLKSLQINPKNEVAYYNLGMAYYRLDQKEDACKSFNEACSLKYKNACKMLVMECAAE
jgi:tetratricopeptide (TPR) repeat protein